MSSYITAGANKFRRAREWATPTLKESAFLERGVLTPEEFVRAGDELVYKCPTWSWEQGDSKKKKTYLPDDKQVGEQNEPVIYLFFPFSRWDLITHVYFPLLFWTESDALLAMYNVYWVQYDYFL